jgi:hypothetical protein
MNKKMLSLVLFGSMVLSGCCANYSVYVKSTDEDLKALLPVYRNYVLEDDRLSVADTKARLAIADEMRAKNDVAKKDVE